jgi:hydrogenase assembly chaperone HypC/HupF
MCLSRPGRVLRRQGTRVEVDTAGVARWYSTVVRPEVRTGDWVLTHANLVLTILTEEEAAEMEAYAARLLGETVHEN